MVLAASASAAVPVWRRVVPAGGEECFASCCLAVYGVDTSVAWAMVAGDTGKLWGHCLPLPSHQHPRGDPVA